MATSKRRDFLKWSVLGVSSIPAISLLQSLNPSAVSENNGDAVSTKAPSTQPENQMSLAVSRLSPFYLGETATALGQGLGQISGQSWSTAPQISDNLLERLQNNEVQAALISPSFYKNFPKKAALFGSIPHGLTDEKFDQWLRSADTDKLREEIYANYGVKAVTLGAFSEASGFYSRHADPLQGTQATHLGILNEHNSSIVMDPFESLTNFTAGRIDRSHTLAHRQHVNLGLPRGQFYYHESRGLRSAAAFELLLSESVWSKLGVQGQYELSHLVRRATEDLRSRLAKLDRYFSARIANMSSVKYVKSSEALESNFLAERKRLFEKVVTNDRDLKEWHSILA